VGEGGGREETRREHRGSKMREVDR